MSEFISSSFPQNEQNASSSHMPLQSSLALAFSPHCQASEGKEESMLAVFSSQIAQSLVMQLGFCFHDTRATAHIGGSQRLLRAISMGHFSAIFAHLSWSLFATKHTPPPPCPWL